MLEGLEAVEIRLQECLNIIDFRIDANTYKKDYLETEKVLKKIGTKTIEDVSTSVQNFGAYSLCSFINFVEKGTPFLMTENIRHNYIDWNIQKCVDDKSHAMLYKSHCKKNQLLVTMSGEYLGRVAVYDKDEICSSNQAIAKITLAINENPFMVSTFLNSKHGQNQINRLKTITGQPNINMSLIKSLKIPNFSNELKQANEELILTSNNLRNQSKALYRQAEDLLLKELGLKDWQPTNKNTAEKSFSSSFLESGRLDAEYYQPKYDELFEQLNDQTTLKLGEIASIQKSIEPGSDAYQTSGIPFLRISNLSKFGLSEPDIHLETKDFDNIIKPRKDTILLSKDGSVGIAYKVTEDMNCITSGAILHLTVKDKSVLSDYLTLVLNSKLTQFQAERDAGGSIIQHWKPSEIQEVIIPILPLNIQQIISDKIQESFVLKTLRKQLLEIAKRGVEIAIEQDEASALAWMEKSV